MSLLNLQKSLSFMFQHPLNQGNRIRTAWRWLRWQLGSRLVSAPVIVPWVDQTSLAVSRGETGLTQNIYCGLHDFSEMSFVLHLIRPEDRFLDIGANSGAYSILAAGCGGASGVAVEPVPSTFKRLQRQLRLNHLENHVTALNVGLAQAPGELYFSTGSDTMNKVVSREWSGPKNLLPVTTLDDIAKETPVFIKIDVEGLDAEVLAGGGQTLASPVLKALVIEMSPASVPILSHAGFAPFVYDPFSRQLTAMSWQQAIANQNVIVIRDHEWVQKRLIDAPKRQFHGKRF